MPSQKYDLANKLIWIDDNNLKVGDINFYVSFGQEMREEESRQGTFVLGKSRQIVEDFQNINLDHPIERIVDLGIYKGGSVVLYQKLFNPKTIIAIEWNKKPVSILDEYITINNLADTVKVYYGIDQSDSKKLSKIVQLELGSKSIDLVIDDASHRLRESRASFNILFPHVAAGGIYVIEDWAWAHWNGDQWQKNGGLFPYEAPLSNLIFEFTMLAASRPDLIESISITANYVKVKKGKGSCSSDDFNITDNYFNRGKKATLLGPSKKNLFTLASMCRYKLSKLKHKLLT